MVTPRFLTSPQGRLGLVPAALFLLATTAGALDQYTVSSLPLPAGIDPNASYNAWVSRASPDGNWIIVAWTPEFGSETFYRYHLTTNTITKLTMPAGYNDFWFDSLGNDGLALGAASSWNMATNTTTAQYPMVLAATDSTPTLLTTPGGITSIDANGVRYGYSSTTPADFENFSTFRPSAWTSDTITSVLLNGTSLANTKGMVASASTGHLAGIIYGQNVAPTYWTLNQTSNALASWTPPIGAGLLPQAYQALATNPDANADILGFAPNQGGVIYTYGLQDNPNTPLRLLRTSNLTGTLTHELIPLLPGYNQQNWGNAVVIGTTFTLVADATMLDANGKQSDWTQFIWEAGAAQAYDLNSQVLGYDPMGYNRAVWGGSRIAADGRIFSSGPDAAASNSYSSRINVLTPAVTINASTNVASVNENGSAVTVTLTRDDRAVALAYAQTVRLIATGDAVSGIDFIQSGATITGNEWIATIPAGAVSTTLTINPLPNSSSYFNATLTLTPSTPTTAPDRSLTGKAFKNGTAANLAFINTDIPISPTPKITHGGTGSVLGAAPTTITVDFAKPVSGFVSGELTASIGTLSALSGSGQVYTATWTPPANSEGTVSFNVAARVANAISDSFLNVAAVPLTITFDAKAPVASKVGLSTWSDSGSSSSDGITSSSYVQLTGTSSESGVQVDLFINDAFQGSTTIPPSATPQPVNYWYVDFWSQNGIGEGVYNAYAKLTDAAGNQTTTATYSFTVDRTPPVVTTTATSAITTTKPSTTWTGNTESGVQMFAEVRKNGSVFNTFPATVSGTTWSVDLPLSAGVYQVVFVAEDLAGNTGISPSFGLTVASSQITDFVTRFYQRCLNRTPDQAGLDDWAGQLGAGTRTGASLATGFVLSQEFINRNLDNSTFVDTLYQAFFNRAADPGGKQGWLDLLNAGAPREDILNGFLFAQEFATLCNTYGITNYSTVDAQKKQIRDFVRRFYQQTLNREPDASGASDWTQQLFAGSRTGATLANGFVDSLEFKNRGLNDDQFLAVMYKAFFDRTGDAGGVANWKSQLSAGKTRLEVVYGFTHAQEFITLCANYGITPFSAGG